jgi:hypothetical protein
MNTFNYQENITFKAFADSSSRKIFAICEVKNIALPAQPENFAAIVWFPNYQLSLKEVEILKLKSYAGGTRKHPNGFLINKVSNGTFPGAVRSALSWFGKLHTERVSTVSSSNHSLQKRHQFGSATAPMKSRRSRNNKARSSPSR